MPSKQFGFRRDRLEDQLILNYEEIIKEVDSGCLVDLEYLDFSQAFDVVNLEMSIIKLSCLDVSNEVLGG